MSGEIPYAIYAVCYAERVIFSPKEHRPHLNAKDSQFIFKERKCTPVSLR